MEILSNATNLGSVPQFVTCNKQYFSELMLLVSCPYIYGQVGRVAYLGLLVIKDLPKWKFLHASLSVKDRFWLLSGPFSEVKWYI